AVAPSRAMSGRSRSLQPPSALASLRARGALVALLGGGMLAVVGTTPGCGASGGAPAKAAWGTAECRSQVLRLPAEPLVVEMRGALRCRRDHVFEDEREHRVDEEVIDYGPLSCLSGCPAGYEAQWFPLRLTLTPAGSLIVEVVGEGAPTTGAEEERGDAAASVGR